VSAPVAMRAALVVTTYNNPRALALCLRSLAAQSSRDFDVFIADDGSRPETRERIDALRPLFGTSSIEHVWHADEGYRKSAINNEAFRRIGRAGIYPVTICVDHDVIVHRRFVEDHLSIHARSGPRTCFMGRRVDLGPQATNRITEDNVVRLTSGRTPELIWASLRDPETTGALRGVRIANPLLQRSLGRQRVPDLLGSNFSVSTDLLHEINGYNEDYRSYWGEDGDLFIRLRNAGAQLRGLKGYAVQWHLHHKRLEPDPQSQTRYQELLNDRDYRRCDHGIAR
jgi:GT2 family glycosyltransferase